MLEDRDYMRQPAHHGPRVSFTIALLIVNAVVFVIELAASNSPRSSYIEGYYFALSLDGLKHGFVWQLLTFQFMHAGWLHIIFNSIVIYFFGRSVETVLGHSRFLMLYLASGIIGGLVQMLFALVFPSFDAPVIGASAGACGLVAAFAVMNWLERFTLLIYFIPVSMRGKTLLWGSLAISFAFTVFGIIIPTGIANAAHLGGILTGFFLARQMLYGSWPQWRFPSRRTKPREFVAARTGQNKFWRSAANQPSEDLPADEFLKNEVDPILDKISAHGIQSLTARERQILEKAREKMTKR